VARPPDPLVGDGLLLVDKPAGMTSHDVVGACRRICGTRKVGHAGTLDPMATGLLLVGVNRATKLLTFLVGCDKAYEATIRLGVATVTDDAEGEVTATADASGLTDARIALAVADLVGDIAQVPSAVSAIKVAGVRSYARVRGGEAVALAARQVRVSAFDVLTRRDGPGATRGPGGDTPYVDLDVAVEVSSGTYVRALARDLGAALGVGGHLTALRRTRIGAFDVADAASPTELEQARRVAAPGTSGLPMLRPHQVTARVMPGRTFDAAAAGRLAHGVRPEADGSGDGLRAAYGPDGRLVAVLEASDGSVSVKAVFANE